MQNYAQVALDRLPGSIQKHLLAKNPHIRLLQKQKYKTEVQLMI